MNLFYKIVSIRTRDHVRSNLLTLLFLILSPVLYSQTPDFSANVTIICDGESIIFTDNSSGFSGSETYSWDFGTGASPATATGAGPHTVSYTGSGSIDVSLTVTDGGTPYTEDKIGYITVNAFPVVTFGSVPDVCIDAAPFNLTQGSPVGGTYSGTGITTSPQFSPAAAGAGTHTITYTYTDGNGCTNSANQSITVNPLPTVTFGAIPDICQNDAPVNLTQGNPAGGTYSGTGITISPQFNPTIAGAGTHTITYTYTDLNGCVNSASQPVTVNPVPTAVISGSSIVCRDDAEPVITFTGANGTTPYTFTYNINGGGAQTVVSTVNIATVNAPTTTDGTFVYNLVSVQDASSTTCSQAQTGSATIVVNPLPTATISGSTAVCQDDAEPVITFTGANATAPYTFTYNINGGGNQTVVSTGNTATVNVPTTTDGTFVYNLISVQDASSTSCSQAQTGSATIVVNPLPTATISGSVTVCQDDSEPVITFTGANATAPYTFTYNINGGGNQTVVSIGNTATITAPTGTDGTYVYNLISVQDASSTACSQLQSGSVTIIVNPLPAPTASNNGPVCVGDQISLTGGPNGMTSYSWSGPAGFTSTLQSPVVSSSATTAMAGNYTLTVVNSNGCQNSVATSVIVNPLPVPAASNNGPICAGTTLSLTGGPVGMTNYSWTGPGGFVSSQQSPTVSTSATVAMSGPYTLVVTNSNGCENTAVTTATVNPLPTATIIGTTVICQDDVSPVVTFTGSNGTAPYTFTYNINGGSNQTITTSGGNGVSVSVPTGSAGVFNYNLISVQDASSTACSQAQSGTATVTINPLPTATISGTTAVCRNDASPNVTFTGAGGTTPYTFTFNINGGADLTVVSTGNTATVPVPTGIAGIYTYNLISVQDASITACTQAQTGNATITVYQLPSPTATNNGPVCAGSLLSLTGGPDGMASYSWTGPNGFTSALQSPTVSPSTTSAMAGVYTLTVINSNGCLNSVTTGVIVNPLPVATAGNNSPICAGTTLSLSGGPAGMTSYSWSGPGGYTSSQQNPTVSSSATVLMSGTYDLTVIDGNGCQSSASTVATVNPLPTANITGTTEVCKDASFPDITFTGSSGTAPYTFTYNINGGGNTTVTTTVGNSVNVPVPTGNAGLFTYNLVNVQDASSTTCSQAQTGSASVTINPLPTATISGSTAVCRDDASPSITFTGANGVAPYTFTYTINSGSNQIITTSSGNSATLSVPTSSPGTFTYSLVSVQDASSTACIQAQGGSATVIVNPLPLATISGSTEVCRDASPPNILFTGSNGTAPYTFTYNINGGSAQTVTSVGNSVTVPVSTSSVGTYTYNLISVEDNSSTSCVQAQSGSATVIVNPLPTAAISGTTSVCRNDTPPEITFTGSNGTPPYTFTYTINSGSNQTITTTSGNSVTVIVPTGTAGIFTYSLVSVRDASSTSCIQTQSGSATVTVNPLPTATISGSTTVCQSDASPSVTFTGNNGTEPYTFTYTINGGSAQTVTTSSGNTVNVAAPTTVAGTFVYELVSVQDNSSSSCLQSQSGTVTIRVNPLPTATISGTTAVCQNSSSPSVTFTGANATAPYTFTYNINGGSAQTITTSTGNSVSVSVPTSSAGTFVYNLLSVEDASSTTCSQAQSGSATVTVNPLPVTPAISGDQTPACSESGVTYSVTLSSGSSYAWTVPSGSVITSGATGPNNNSITVDFDQFNGNISVVQTLPTGCSGAAVSLPIALQGCLLDANFEASSTSVCNGSSIIFTDLSTGVSGSTTYSWNFGTGASPATATGTGPHTVTYTGTGTRSVSLTITEGASDTELKSNYITVNPLPTASISGTTSVCRDDASPMVTFTGASGTAPYTFNYTINGGSIQSVTTTSGNSVSVPASTSVAGVFLYELVSVQDASSSSCLQAQSGSAAITVNPLPTAAISGTTDVCESDSAPLITFTGSSGTSPYTFTYNINGGANLTISTTAGNNSVNLAVATSIPGTYTYNLVSVQDGSSTACEQAQSGSATVIVNPLPTATISGNNEVCQNAASPNVTFTGANGTAPYTFTYTINGGAPETVTTTVGNSVTVGVPTDTDGTFVYELVSVQDASSTACEQAQTGSATVIVNPLPTATISGTTTVCRDASFPSILFTGGGGTAPYTFTYNVNGGGNQTITTTSGNSTTVSVPTGIPGTYTYNLVSVRDASSTSCIQSQTGSAVVTVNPLPSATITGNTAVCRDAASPQITFTGTNGTAPYTFTYTINSGAEQTVTTTSGNIATVDVPTGTVGTFTYALIRVQDASSTACEQIQTGSATVVVNPLPQASISGTTAVCKDGTSPLVTFTGSNGTAPYTFTYNINGGSNQNVTTTSGSSVTVSVPTSTAGVFSYNLVSVRDASSTSCIQSQTGSAVITVNPLPVATISGSTVVCRDAVSPAITFTGSNGTTPYTFTYTVNSGPELTVTTSSGNSVSVPVPTNIVGTFTYSLVRVRDGSTTACSQTQAGSATVIINPLPTATISGSTEVCRGGTAPSITFSGFNGTAPYTFSYNINGGATQFVTTTTGNSISVPAPTSTAGTFNYNLLSVQDASSTACLQSQSGTATVLVNPLPTATITGTTAVCRFGTEPVITFTGSGGTAPYIFTYTINGGSNQLVTSTGNTATVDVPTNSTGTFTYSLVSVRDASTTSCSQAQSGSAVVTINPLPTATISGTTEVCEDATYPDITFTGSNGTAPYTFTYNINGGSNQTVTTIVGNSVTVQAPTTSPGTFTYNLISVEDGSTSSCTQSQSGSATVTVNPLPAATISGTTAVCQNSASPEITFTGANGTAPYTFTYNINGGANQTVSTSTGNSVSVNAPTTDVGDFTYNLVSVRDASSTSCLQNQTGSATITINPLPVTPAITGDQTPACGESGVVYSLSLSSGSSYAWSVPTGAVITSGATGPNNNSITVDFDVNNGNISVIQTLPTGCSGSPVSLPINLQGCNLDANFEASNTSLCDGSSITFTDLSTGVSGSTTYSWNFGSGATPAVASGIGPHTVSYTGTGSKTVSLTITEGASNTETKTNYITVNPLPTATISGNNIVCRDAPSPLVTFTGANGTAPYTFTYTINSGSPQTVTTSSGNSVTVPAPTNAAGVYTYALVSVQDGSSTACSQAQSGTAVITVNPLPTATISGTTEVCEDDAFPVITFTGAGSTSPYTFTYNVNGGSNQTITSTGNTATILVPTATTGTYSYNLVSVRDASSTSCVQSQTGSAVVTVYPLPTATISGTTTVCKDAPLPNITFTGANGTAPYTFTYTINSGSPQSVTTTVGNSVTVGAPTGTVGSFTYALVSVEDSSPTSCVQAQTGGATVTVNPLPTATISGSTSVCRDAAFPIVTFTGANGTAPYTFTYNINGGSNLTVTTTSGNSTTVSVPTGIPGTYSYNLISVRDASSTACIQSQTGSAIIIVNPLPTATISGSTTVCKDASSPLITFTGANGTAPYTFTYSINSGPDLTVSTTSGNSVTVPVPTGTVGTYTYALISVQDASTTACIQGQTGSATVVINPLPTANISGTTDICRDGPSPGITFTGLGGTAPYTFTYNINGGSSQTVTTTSGNSVSVLVPTSVAGTFVYNLISVQDASSTACIQSQTGSATIRVNPLPTASISGTTSVCRNGTSPLITFTGANGTAPYTFTYTVNGGSNQTVTTTSGNTATVSVPTSTVGSYTYSLVSVQDASSTACTQLQSGTAVVNVNPLPTATISGTVAVCEDAAFPDVTFTGSNGTAPYTFTYNINGGSNLTVTTILGNNVTVSAPTTTPGTYTYNLVSVQDASSSSCIQAQSGLAVVTVNPLPTATISGTTSVCRNSTSPLITFTGASGTAPYTFTYNINGGSNQTITSTGNSVTVSVPTGTVGDFTYNLVRVQDASSTACSQNQSGSATVTVNPLPVTPPITGDQTPACGESGVVYSLSLSTGSSYAWSVPAGAVITSGSTGPNNNSITVNFDVNNGNISVIQTLPTGCSGSPVSLPISLQGCALNANFDASSTSLCDGASITFTDLSTGVSGLTEYDWNFGTGATPATATGSGPHTVSYAGTGSKTVSLTITEGASDTETKTDFITVNPLPTATISGDNVVCRDAASPLITFTGANGTAPYTFTYTINGGSPLTVTTISGNSVTVPAPTNTAGTFTYALVSVQDGSLTTCSQAQSGTAVITVNPLPTATVSGTTEVCEDDAFPVITFTGNGGTSPYTFTYNINGGSNQTITSTGNTATLNVPTALTGTYTYNLVSVRDASITSCIQGQSGSATITVNPLPTATISGTTTVCRDAPSPNITFTGLNGTEPYTFTYTVNSGSPQYVTTTVGNTATVPVPTGTAGSLTYALVAVQDASSTACEQTQPGSVTVTINPLPTASVSGTITVCRDDASPTVTFTGANGTAPYTFTYNVNGGINQTVTTVSGNSVQVSVPTGMAGDYSYNLVSVRDASTTSCIQAQTGSAVIRVNPLPVATISGTTTVCQNDPRPDITFTGSNGTAPYTFTYTINSGVNRTVTTSSGNSVTVSVPTGTIGNYTYALVSVQDASSTACEQVQTGSVTVIVNPLPIATISGEAEVCRDAPSSIITFIGANGIPPYTFTYNINGGTEQVITSASGDSAQIAAPTDVPGVYDYNLVSVRDASSTSCVRPLSGQVTITVNQLPTASISGTAEACLDAPSPFVTFTGASGVAPYTFTYNINSGTPLTVTTTSGNSVDVSVPTNATGTFTYSLVSVRDASSTACFQSQTGSAVVTVNPLPTATVTGDAEICANDESPLITFTGDVGPAPYTFRYRINDGIERTITTSDGNSISIPVPTDAPGSYSYNLINVLDSSEPGCAQTQAGSATVVVYEVPVSDAGTATDQCDLDFQFSAIPSAGTGTWTLANGPGTAIFNPSSTQPDALVTVSEYGTYTFKWKEVNGLCYDSSSVDVNFYIQPVADPGAGGSSCDLTFQLDATPDVGTGIWTQTSGPGTTVFSPAATDPDALAEVTEYGRYTYTWTETNESCSDAANITVDFYEQPVANAGSGGNNCGLEYRLGAVQGIGNGMWRITAGPGTGNFVPDEFQPNARVTVSNFGEYTLTWYELNGSCLDSASIVVNFVDAPLANGGPDGDECDLDYTFGASLSGGTGSWSLISGSGSAVFQPGIDREDAEVTVDEYGNYSFGWTEVNVACESTDTVNVIFRELPFVSAGEDTTICTADTVTLRGSGIGNYYWTPDTLVYDPVLQTNYALPDSSRYYYLTLTDEFGCINTDSVYVTVRNHPVANAGPDQTTEYWFSTVLDAVLEFEYEYGVWSVISGSGNFLDTTFAQTQVEDMSVGENIFLWKVYNEVCPPDGDSVSVIVQDLKVSTLITPNGDANNEYLIFPGIENLGKADFTVFDRTGAVVYEDPDYQNDWNGVDYNGNPLPNDTYFYILKGENGIVRTSFIVVRR